MPRDLSSSSSEDEADAPTQKSPVKKKESGKFTHKHTHRVEQSCCWVANTQIVESDQIHEAKFTQKYKTSKIFFFLLFFFMINTFIFTF